MSILKQLLKEMSPHMAPYGGVVQLDKVDQLKNDPDAVATPFTRYLQARNAAEEEEQNCEALVDFLIANPMPTEEQLASYAAECGKEVPQLKAEITDLLVSLLHGRKQNSIEDGKE